MQKLSIEFKLIVISLNNKLNRRQQIVDRSLHSLRKDLKFTTADLLVDCGQIFIIMCLKLNCNTKTVNRSEQEMGNSYMDCFSAFSRTE